MVAIKIVKAEDELLFRYEPTSNCDVVCAKLSVSSEDSGTVNSFAQVRGCGQIGGPNRSG